MFKTQPKVNKLMIRWFCIIINVTPHFTAIKIMLTKLWKSTILKNVKFYYKFKLVSTFRF